MIKLNKGWVAAFICLWSAMYFGGAIALDSTPQEALATNVPGEGWVSETERPPAETIMPEETMAPTPEQSSAGPNATAYAPCTHSPNPETYSPSPPAGRNDSGSAEPTFLVTIPSSVTAQEGAFAIACEMNGEVTVKVTVSSRNGFKLINGAAELPYALSRQGESAALGDGDVAAIFNGTDVQQLDITLLGRPTAAGTYADTLTIAVGAA